MAASFAEPPVAALLHVDAVEQGRSVRLIVTGEVDSSSAPLLGQALDGALDGRPEQLVVDLCAVTFLDSAGLSTLAVAHRRAREQQVTLRVLASASAVVRPLQITGLWKLLGAERVETGTGDQGVA